MPIPAGPPLIDLGAYRPATFPLTDIYLEVDGWAAPALDDNGTTWVVQSVEGWNGTPETRTAGSDRQADHGSFDAPAYYGSRVITAEGFAVSPTRDLSMLAQDVMASVCGDMTRLTALIVVEPGRPARRCHVRLNAATKVAPVYGGYAFDWSLQLKAPDPRRYADAETVITLTLPTGAGTGLTVPFTVPFSIPSSVATNAAAAVNDGTFSTRPVVTFYGPVVNPAIANLTQGRTLAFDYTVNAGETLTVDFDARSVLLNGDVSRAYAISPGSAWWEIQPGINDLQYQAGGGTGQATVTYRGAWL